MVSSLTFHLFVVGQRDCHRWNRGSAFTGAFPMRPPRQFPPVRKTACRFRGIVFRAYAARSPVTEWQVLHLPAPLKKDFARFRIADNRVRQ